MRKGSILVTCPKAVPPVLSSEIAALGLPVLNQGAASVETEGSMVEAMRLNLHLRTGHRVLWRLDQFKAASPDDLYARLSRIPWEDWLMEDGYMSVTSSVRTTAVRDSRYVNLKAKDAVADRMRKKLGRRPDSGPEHTGAVLFVYWKDEDCAVYLDTSGEPLSKRGYRKMPFRAPMQESLAAAAVLISGWRDDGPFVNPMCGSGTLATEAALIGLNRAPGIQREHFAFMALRGFQEDGGEGWRDAWEEMRRQAKKSAKRYLDSKVLATDLSPEAIRAARTNVAAAGLEGMVELGTCDFRETDVPRPAEGERGVVMLNPEYGERLGKVEELGEIYAAIGDFLKQRCRGYEGYILTGNPSLAKRVGLRAKRRTPLWNGKIECRLLEYELYEGSRRERKDGSAPDEP